MMNQLVESEIKRMKADDVSVVNGKLILADEDTMFQYIQNLLDEEHRLKQGVDDTDENVLFEDLFKFRGIIGQGMFGVVLLVQTNQQEASPLKREFRVIDI
jgi:hypothetical protein